MLAIDKTKQLFPLTGEGIQLRLFQESDINDTYIGWLNDQDVVKYSNQRFRQHSKESCLTYYHTVAQSNALFLCIVDQKQPTTIGTMIGTMTVYFNTQHQTADIGIMVGNKDYWGQGIGREAWLLLLTLLLESVNVRKVTGGTLSCNRGMVKIMESCGMAPDGIRVKQELIDGQAYDIVHFAAFSDSF